MFDPGTYIFDGDGWIQISGNTSAGDGVINGANFITTASPGDNPIGTSLLSLSHSGSGSVVQTTVPDIWPNYLRTTSLLDPTDGYRAAPRTIGAAGQVLRVEGTGAAARVIWGNPSSSSLAIENSEADILSSTGIINFDDDAFDVQVDGTVSDQVNVVFTYPINADVPGVTTGVEDFPDVRRLQIGDGLTFTPTLLVDGDLNSGFLGTLSVAGATITVEGNDGNNDHTEFTGITLIDFNPNDFLVTSSATGEVVVSAIGSSGGALVLEDDDTVEVNALQTLNFGTGLIATPDNGDPAQARSADIVIDHSLVPRIVRTPFTNDDQIAIDHNLDVEGVIVQVYVNDGTNTRMIIPEEITLVNNNRVLVDLPAQLTGTVIITG